MQYLRYGVTHKACYGYQTGYSDGYKKAINDMKKCLEDVERNIYLAERNNQI